MLPSSPRLRQNSGPGGTARRDSPAPRRSTRSARRWSPRSARNSASASGSPSPSAGRCGARSAALWSVRRPSAAAWGAPPPTAHTNPAPPPCAQISFDVFPTVCGASPRAPAGRRSPPAAQRAGTRRTASSSSSPRASRRSTSSGTRPTRCARPRLPTPRDARSLGRPRLAPGRQRLRDLHVGQDHWALGQVLPRDHAAVQGPVHVVGTSGRGRGPVAPLLAHAMWDGRGSFIEKSSAEYPAQTRVV